MLYTDLSGYYDLMCADIDYPTQSKGVRRLHQLFGNGGNSHLDLACGTGPHIRHFIDSGYQCQGLDINQPMLDVAQQRCPEAMFHLQNMCDFRLEATFDLITCFLYSIHYSDGVEQLKSCLHSAHDALTENGLFCFNAVDKTRINNKLFVSHTAQHGGSEFTFHSGWQYCGQGEQQSLLLSINKRTKGAIQAWQDEHAMVALSFSEFEALLQPLFDVHVLEHDYDRIVPWDGKSGNALFVCIKR
ncbi:class I SAM-dependent methyltransferase [Marinobacter sp.]|uniref:class I SAM-dependent DNA methyltransferase n=1 Tax=Marinobacter sp. TaxID=50741 RepID=UPI001A0B5EC6|nr:class I SAM-dependent methyltransferase [Marinobacter sp.]MBE0487406.1 class I SAM-dependent methyltransferase [Marinobacter sp.]